MEDTTFSALAQRAKAYPTVQRRNQISRVIWKAREGGEEPLYAGSGWSRSHR